MQKDYIAFVDGGSLVPYYVSEGTYSRKPPLRVIESYTLDFKTYSRIEGNRYYISVAPEQLIRFIRASDFNLIKAQLNKQTISMHLQLSFDFC